jgi:hypothetical protein
MSRVLLDRLAVPGAMAVVLLLSLAYWWLDNVPHEVFGTLLFVLIIRHVIVNRAWFRKLAKGRYNVRRTVTVILHLLLIANMLVLLMTSLVISKTLYAAIPLPNAPSFRAIHWFSAYWVLVIVSIHLGIHWTRVVALVRSSLGLTLNRTRTFVLRGIAMVIVVFGTWSFTVLGVWTKLTFTYSLEFWDFTSSVSPFFAHWAGVVGLFGVVTHYAMRGLSARRQADSGIFNQ